MGNRLFLRARGWGIDYQVRKKCKSPRVCPGGMVTGRIEPCIIYYQLLSNIIDHRFHRAFNTSRFAVSLLLGTDFTVTNFTIIYS